MVALSTIFYFFRILFLTCNVSQFLFNATIYWPLNVHYTSKSFVKHNCICFGLFNHLQGYMLSCSLTLNNVWYNKGHWLTGWPYLAIIACNGGRLTEIVDSEDNCNYTSLTHKQYYAMGKAPPYIPYNIKLNYANNPEMYISVVTLEFLWRCINVYHIGRASEMQKTAGIYPLWRLPEQ